MAIDFDPQIPFKEEDQQGAELCWIAVAVSVKHHFDNASQMRQCELVKDVLGISGPCCTNSGGVRKKCDKPGRLEDALGHPSVDHLAAGTAAHPNPKGGGALTFAEIQTQIDNKLPVCIFIKWPGKKIGHFILISGYLESGGQKYVYVNDPLFGGGPQPYNRVVSNYNLEHGTWQWTYRLKV
jgi:hypothetical protein